MGLDVAADLSLVFDHITPADEQLPGNEKFNLIKDLDFFNDFSESETWEVINASTWQDFNPDTEIILEGEVDKQFLRHHHWGCVGTQRRTRRGHPDPW